jgi:hypothetical protein
MWESDYRSRRVVSEFLRDESIGKKRLASMPDRVTNTLQLSSGGHAFRPAVTNCYDEMMGKLDNLDEWFEKWLDYMFDQQVDVDGKGGRPVHSLLQKISKAKYPAITEEEEKASVPLQLVLQGVFDAILIHLMQTNGRGIWQGLRREICAGLNKKKSPRIIEILQTTYGDADVIFLTEAGNELVDMLKKEYSASHHVVIPKSYSAKRNQNSVMLLRNSLFTPPEEVHIPAVGWDDGDLLVVKTHHHVGKVTLAAFHGDTNGLLTMPMLEAVAKQLPTKRFLFGLDANTYERESKSTAHVLDFERLYKMLGFQSCWGAAVDPTRYTTFNARTFMQAQLNKAAKSTQLAEKGDRNPKDFVLFTKHFTLGRVWRDNTGRAEYTEDMVFPTLEFPSDHAVVAVDLVMNADAQDPSDDEL